MLRRVMASKTGPRELVAQRVQALQVSAPADGIDLAKAVGTHNGHFHCDEAFAVGMLQLTPHAGWPVVRTRDAEVLGKCGIVVDVGATFDPKAKRFDHHQRGFEETLGGQFETKLSSAGLVYKYFGRQIIQALAEACQVPVSKELEDVLFTKVYQGFVEHIDGIDNGIDAYTGDKRYSITTHLSARVGALNPSWNEEQTTEQEMACFRQAVELTTTEFADHVAGLLTVWLPARSIVEQAAKTRLEVDASGEILRLEQACPWKSHLFNLEEEGAAGLEEGKVKYVLYPDSNGAWRVQCVSVEENSFTNRRSLPSKYCGVRDQALSDLWGIPGCIFVHASGFIGGNATYEGALEMARRSLTEA